MHHPPRLLSACLFMLFCGCSDDARPARPGVPSTMQGDGDDPSTTDPATGDGDDPGEPHGAADAGGSEPGDGDTTAVDAGHPEHDAGMPEVALDAPDTSRALVAFLDAHKYEKWAAEPDYHASSGPHGGAVRVFYSPRAQHALEQGAQAFPNGAAVIKELTDSGSLYGWAVWVKVDAATDHGKGFYWYELIRGDNGQDEVYGDARGSDDCVDCHAPGRDYLLSSGTFQ